MYELRVVRERRPEYGALETLRDARAVYEAFKERFEKADREEFIAIHLDGRNQVIGFNVVSIGSVTATLVHPRELYKPAILANAVALILVHNHPSGDPEPSAEDRALTMRLVQAGEIIGIKILDHVVIGDGRFASFAERQLLSRQEPTPSGVGSFRSSAGVAQGGIAARPGPRGRRRHLFDFCPVSQNPFAILASNGNREIPPEGSSWARRSLQRFSYW